MLGSIRVENKYKYQPQKNEVSYYIGRGSDLGNPFSHKQNTKACVVCETREQSITAYKLRLHIYLALKKDLKSINEIQNLKVKAQYKRAWNIRQALNKIFADVRQGKNVVLICYCKPQPCHGDVIKEIIEGKLEAIPKKVTWEAKFYKILDFLKKVRYEQKKCESNLGCIIGNKCIELEAQLDKAIETYSKVSQRGVSEFELKFYDIVKLTKKLRKKQHKLDKDFYNGNLHKACETLAQQLDKSIEFYLFIKNKENGK